MPKGQKTNASISTDFDTCPICGYTCKNFKDLKYQSKMVSLHIEKEHGVTNVIHSRVDTRTFNINKNETLLSTLAKLRQEEGGLA
jgi:hypothetical protein